MKKFVTRGLKGGVAGAGAGLGVGVSVASAVGASVGSGVEVGARVVAGDVVTLVVVVVSGFTPHATTEVISSRSAIKTERVFHPFMVSPDVVGRVSRILEFIVNFIISRSPL